MTPGSRIGPYEVIVPLGAGAMGEVYRVRDTRLARTVALKVLTATDPRRIARLENGDAIRLGSVVLTFRAAAAPGSTKSVGPTG